MEDVFFVVLSVGLFGLSIWYVKGLRGLEEDLPNE